MFSIFARLTSENYKGVISVENPYGGFSKLCTVTDMCKLPGWCLITQADHCSNTCELDTRDFPNKPTTYLLFNTLPTLELKQCKQDCLFRLPNAPNRHKLLVCSHCMAALGQRVIRSVVNKSRVPLGIFQRIFRHRRRHDGRDCAFTAIWAHKLHIALLAVACTTCTASNDIMPGTTEFHCKDCHTANTVVGSTTMAPAPATPADGMTDADLWHARCAHTNRVLDGVCGFKLPRSTEPSCLCATCAMTRQSEKKRTKAQGQSVHERRASRPLEMVYVDLHGPCPEQSFGGYRFAAVFVDSFSGYVYVHPLRRKSDAVDALQHFIAQISRPTENMLLQCVNTNGGSEFLGAFTAYCRENCIRVRRSKAYTLWRNGQVEIFNRRLKSMS